MGTKIDAGTAMPELELPLVGGGTAQIGGARDGWQLVVVYRGKHCPKCKQYLATLERLQDAVAEVAALVTVSCDPEEKAVADVAEQGWTFSVAYGLTPEQARTLGLYVSAPRSPQETDRPFAEPGVFAVNPAGQVQVVDISNAPFSRPDLEGLVNGLKFIQANDYPIRGTL